MPPSVSLLAPGILFRSSLCSSRCSWDLLLTRRLKQVHVPLMVGGQKLPTAAEADAGDVAGAPLGTGEGGGTEAGDLEGRWGRGRGCAAGGEIEGVRADVDKPRAALYHSELPHHTKSKCNTCTAIQSRGPPKSCSWTLSPVRSRPSAASPGHETRRPLRPPPLPRRCSASSGSQRPARTGRRRRPQTARVGLG